jgi:hypothetical protein
MSNLHRGSCLCGAVQFQLDGTFERFYLCHCEYCRKDTGSAHAANLFSSTARLRWIAGEDRISTYQLPQTRHARCFCSICGSAMPVVTARMVVVPAGCLDTDPSRRPDAHIFVSSRAPWDHDLAVVPAFEKFPS